ncbi:MAG TPA: ABC transporter ATP-binding protein [Flavobacteriaceae bacterium]|nr:ABC transporter ATP-binding protein [Flavobacteriaceae bacterium]
MKELKYINKFFIKYKWRLLFGLLITVIATLFTLLVPMKIGDSIDVIREGIEGETTDMEYIKSEMLRNIFIIIGSALLSAFFTFLMRQTIIVVSRFIEYDLKNEVFQQYEKLSLSFYKENRTGDLMNRISEDVSSVRMYAGPALMYSTSTVTLFIVVITYMLIKAPILTLYTITPLPILSYAIYRLSIAIHHKSTIVQQYLSKLTTATQESFSGIRIIKAYGIEERHYDSFKDLANSSKDKNIDLAKVQALFFPLMLLLIGLSNVLVLYIGGKQYINGTIELGTVVEFLIYVNMLSWPVASVGYITSMVQRAEASQKRINEFLQIEPKIVSPNDIQVDLQGDIVFENVSFVYPDTGIKALKNINLHIKRGETIAIMGNTGSGKSTLLDLIGRLYDPTEGRLLLDNTDAREINLKSLRGAIGYVPQDSFLFSESIKHNIRFGKKDATQQEVENAAKQASVHHNIVGLIHGYDTVLGERGITLSGGQKQRISIARAFIKDPVILLLDDSLSAVDTETEETILNNLKDVATNKSTLLVSHRVSTAKNADRIIVLENGEIIQEGTHKNLLNTEGYYKDLYTKQLLEK